MIMYHNPRCSKSRQTLERIRTAGVEPRIVDYLKTPLDVAELDRICAMLGCEPTQIIRKKEARFRELGLSLDDKKSRAEWLKILAANPVLIERPIVVKGRRAVMGRPPENVDKLLME